MISVYSWHEGDTPLLISVPHDGVHIPDGMRSAMTPAGLAVPDTDWHVAELYDFAREMGASMLVANYSRYVVDLNRPASDAELYPGQLSTGICPEKTFAGEAIYTDGGVSDEQKSERVDRYWRPYHERLAAALDERIARYGRALLWDAHSIPSVVPRLFDGELPELNIGTNDGDSCSEQRQQAVVAAAQEGPYSMVLNGRFKGGYITRHYGRLGERIDAMQLEIAQRAYMDERSTAFDAVRAGRLRETLQAMLSAFSDD